MSAERPFPTIAEQRQQIAHYVESIAEATRREATLSSVVEAALAHNILDLAAQIPDQLISEWYLQLFGEQPANS